MNTQIVAALTRGAAARQGRRTSLKAFKEADLQCKMQVPTCETALSAVCQPGPGVQECLDNTSHAVANSWAPAMRWRRWNA